MSTCLEAACTAVALYVLAVYWLLAGSMIVVWWWVKFAAKRLVGAVWKSSSHSTHEASRQLTARELQSLVRHPPRFRPPTPLS